MICNTTVRDCSKPNRENVAWSEDVDNHGNQEKAGKGPTDLSCGSY